VMNAAPLTSFYAERLEFDSTHFEGFLFVWFAV